MKKAALGIDTSAAEVKYNEAQQKITQPVPVRQAYATQINNDLAAARNCY
jgi:hypothetical protein